MNTKERELPFRANERVLVRLPDHPPRFGRYVGTISCTCSSCRNSVYIALQGDGSIRQRIIHIDRIQQLPSERLKRAAERTRADTL